MMDIDHDAHGSESTEGRQVIVPGEALPGTIHLIPHEFRPFFPGQAIPLVLNAELWLPTLKAVRDRGDSVIGVVATRERLRDKPKAADLFEMGTVCRVHRVHQQEEQIQILLEGIQRFSIRGWVHEEMPLLAQVRYHREQQRSDTDEIKAYAVAIINTIKELIPLNPLYGEELKVFLGRSNPNEPSVLADFAASLTSASRDQLQDVLETLPLLPRLEKALALLNREVQIASAQMEIRQHVEGEMQAHQRQAFLREQLKFIQRELGITKDDRTAEVDELRERLENKTVPDKVGKRLEDEFHKLSLLETGSPEFGVTRNYLDWLTDLPWGIDSEDSKDLEEASAILDASHDGLSDVKDRILEFLGVGIMKGTVSGSILLFVGPPGVGKTSLGRSIADAMGRSFYRFSVGGMRDEAEIKGHRRTYIGAMPGKLIRALRDAGTQNPVIMLDEVDKIGASFQGDPASALLEVLDPEQNQAFHDHYLDVDVDLSKVLFICTANQLDTIPPALLDRMDIIRLSGYLAEEKLAIARNHLLPRQLQRAGLARSKLSVHKAALKRIIDGYARDAGVRRLDKALGNIVRKAVMQLLRGENGPIKVRAQDVDSYLGLPLHPPEARQQGVGVVTGLAWTTQGGASLPVEASRVHASGRGLKLTGQLGEVMRESADIAWDYVQAHAAEFDIDPEYFASAQIHLHVPAGATPKDGPSAGITMATALISLARGRAPRRNLAMTGELTLTGQVYPVGGIREKLIAARRQGVKQVLLPEANRRDVEDIPGHIKKGLEIHYVKTCHDVIEMAFQQG
ncbi:MAG: endopeptidase La [Gammaproteobacteria bacterium]|nr:MAG: endopeptidase La [Gammaproteobacteria bacterium]